MQLLLILLRARKTVAYLQVHFCVIKTTYHHSHVFTTQIDEVLKVKSLFKANHRKTKWLNYA